ncbi:MAG TPA: alpha-E domain-containing protein [Candidatus Margulisiibacteriota bacterium]|nr:alpha-E domain-containing protein [Candidatus Margulisiibacteriota bacterium]
MLSRIADSLYWMSRYLERAGNTARLIEINLLYLLEAEDALSPAAQWRPLLSINGSEEAYATCYPNAEITAHKMIQFMTQERSNPNAIRSTLGLARENARVVRDRISKEMWEAMNELWLQMDRQLQSPLLPERAARVYAEVRNGVARFHGLTSNTMMRGEGWDFYALGTFLERADMTARILDVKYHLLLPDLSMVGSPLDYYQWAALLRSLSGFEAFRRKYHAGLRPIDVGEFVIFEREFPRSLRFCVDRMHSALADIGPPAADSPSIAAMNGLVDRLGNLTSEQVFQQGLHEFLQDFLDQISDLHGALAADYFDAQPMEQRCAT